MNAALMGWSCKVLYPLRLTGPLFGKELRVSSRRARNYFLRFAYIAFLTFFVILVWLSTVKFQGTAAVQRSRMALAGKTIITTIVMFQFIATQVIAVIMLSTSISDEVYHRTLGLLMTTPIDSLQIVLGKLFSKLLQLILLLAISLPLLAIVRVFGGIPWSYLLSSLSMTLTAVLFAGSVSLYFSINNRRAYVVILKTVGTLGVLYVFLPAIIGSVLAPAMLHKWTRILTDPGFGSSSLSGLIFLHTNPFAAMSFNTRMMLTADIVTVLGAPFPGAAVLRFYWPVHCALMLGLSGLLLARCVRIVRKGALSQASGQVFSPGQWPGYPRREAGAKSRRSRKATRQPSQAGEPQDVTGSVKPVKGPPVLWKELRAPMIQGADSRNSRIGLAVTIGALLITYGVCAGQGCLDQNFAHTSYALMFLLMGSVFTLVRSATSITSEKESRTWPLLLATSMSDWQIVLGKAIAVCRRSLPVWLLLAGHLVLFVAIGFIHPIAIVHLSMLVVWLSVFITSVGLYFSARFRRTTAAVVATFALIVFLWIVIPSLLGFATAIRGDRIHAFRASVSSHPLVQATIVMNGASGRINGRSHLSDLEYAWPHGRLKIGPTSTILLASITAYTLAGLLFAWRAKCRLRKNVF